MDFPWLGIHGCEVNIYWLVACPMLCLLTDLLTKSAAHNLAVFLEGNVRRWITAGTCTNYGSPSTCDDLWGVCGHIYRIWGNYKADNKVFQVQLIYFTIKFATHMY